MGESRSSLQEIQLALERFASRENRVQLYETLAQRAGIDLPPQSCWLLYRLADRPACTVHEVAERLKVASTIIEPALRGLVAAGMVAEVRRGDDHDLALTPAGTAAIERLTEARRSGLTELLEGWNPREHPEVIDMVKELASALMADDERMVADALPCRASVAAVGSVDSS
jgi:DNA-binding MarR family transcriptional regulator